ncbi:hypothetical protein BJY00DRAFT_285557 [Aspergillus carlsbadensis]|nr:hypothetical protein BJY00DRAFT_285557 [Aspergillus carlsbadensis]
MDSRSNPDIPSISESSATARSFLFVDTQDDVSQEFGVGREKMAFLSKLAHQRRKKESVARLRSTQRTQGQLTATTREALSHTPLRQRGWALTGHLGQGYVDPFDTSSVAMTDSMNMYFHHFRVQVAPTTIPFDGAREGSVWAQRSAALPALRYIGLFLAAENKAVLESTHGVTLSTRLIASQEAIRYRVEAIRHLNRLLQEPATAAAESTMFCVSTMKHCEALNGQFTALKAHKKGLRALIDFAGGLQILGHALLSTIYQYSIPGIRRHQATLTRTRGDIATSALNDSQPCFPMLPSFRSEVLGDAEMFSHSDRNYDYEHSIPRSLSGFGKHFTTAPWSTNLDPDMKTTLSACRRLFLHFEMGTRFPILVKPTDKDLYIILLHHLLSLRYAPRDDNELNEPLRRTLFIYTYLRIWNFGSFTVTRYIMDGLMNSLIPRLEYLRAMAPDLLLWILFIGSIASQGYDSYNWFVGSLRDVAVHLALAEWGAAESLLVRFFYTDRPGYRMGEDIWNQVMASARVDIAHRVSECISQTTLTG